jgi:hypothetical protein
MIQEVTDAFEELYQGTGGKPGLKDLECLLPSLQVPQCASMSLCVSGMGDGGERVRCREGERQGKREGGRVRGREGGREGKRDRFTRAARHKRGGGPEGLRISGV